VKSGFIFIKIARIKFNPAFFCNAVCVHGLDSYRLSPVGDIVTRFANRARSAKLVRSRSKYQRAHEPIAKPLSLWRIMR